MTSLDLMTYLFDVDVYTIQTVCVGIINRT